MGVFIGIYVIGVGILWAWLPRWRGELALAERQLVAARIEVKRAAPLIRQRAETAELILWQGQRVLQSAFDLGWRALIRTGARFLVGILGGRFWVRIWAVPLMRAVVRSWQARSGETWQRGEER